MSGRYTHLQDRNQLLFSMGVGKMTATCVALIISTCTQTVFRNTCQFEVRGESGKPSLSDDDHASTDDAEQRIIVSITTDASSDAMPAEEIPAGDVAERNS